MSNVVIQGREVPAPTGPISPAGPLSTGIHGGLLAEAPAVLRRDWLPDVTPDLAELRTQHNQLLDRAGEVDAELRSARGRHEAQDAEYAEALRAQAGGETVEIPSLAGPQEREAELAALTAEALAIAQVLEQFIRGAIADITDNYQDWTAALEQEDADAARAVEAAEQALAAATVQLGARSQLGAWLQRTAGRHPIFKTLDARQISYGDLAGVGGFRLAERAPQPEPIEDAASAPVASPEARALHLAERAQRFNSGEETL